MADKEKTKPEIINGKLAGSGKFAPGNKLGKASAKGAKLRRAQEIMAEFGLESRNPNKESKTDGGWQGRRETMQKQMSGEEPLKLRRSHEYASSIIYGCETGDPVRINGNVRNTGIITNLPDGCCVEVPCLVDNTGVKPCQVGDLPPQLAALNKSNIAVQELTAQAVLDRDLRKAYYATLLDPLTAAVCTTAQVKQMFDQMVKAEGDLLAYMK